MSQKLLATRLCAVLTLCALFATNLHAEPAPSTSRPAGGVRTDFGDVLIDNLGIGRTYNLRDLAGIPFKVKNTGAATVDLQVDVIVPEDRIIGADRKKAGYKPIPSMDWVKLNQSKFIVPSGESALTDILITIPNDPTLYGKKFQASLYSRTIGEGALNVGVWSHLLLNIALSPEDQARVEKNRKQGLPTGMEYSLLPDKLLLENFPIGKKVSIRKTYRRTVMLANSGTIPANLKATVIPIKESPLTLQLEYEAPADFKWMTLSKTSFEIEPSDFVDPGIEISLPNDPSLRGKKLMFVIKVEPSDPDITGVTYYAKIYVNVEGAK